MNDCDFLTTLLSAGIVSSCLLMYRALTGQW